MKSVDEWAREFRRRAHVNICDDHAAAQVIREARNEALEEAAKIVTDGYLFDSEGSLPKIAVLKAAAVRKLKDAP